MYYQNVMKLPKDLFEFVGRNLSSLAVTINFIKKLNFKIKYKISYYRITFL